MSGALPKVVANASIRLGKVAPFFQVLTLHTQWRAEPSIGTAATDGEMIITGGGDKEVKVWGYDEGQCFRVGKGHSGAVTKAKFAPDGEKIVSVGAEGAIFIWQNVQIP